MLLCEYQEWVKKGMRWLLESINVILLEDSVTDSFRAEVRAGFTEIQIQMNQQFTEIRDQMNQRFDELQVQIQPQIQFERMLTAEDLRHE